MATTSEWSAYVEAAVDPESGTQSTGAWSPWVSAATAGQTEWRVAGVSSWLSAELVTIVE